VGEYADTTARKTYIIQSILSVINPDITITGRSLFISLINTEMESILWNPNIDSE
jgi:hypothetical protein